MPITRRLALAAFVAATLPVAASASSLNISGSTTVQNALIGPYQSEIEAQSSVTLNVVGNGTSNGMADLIEGRADIAMISAPLGTVVAGMEAKTPGVSDGITFESHQVAETRVAFLVHPSNSVRSLTLLEVEGILAGHVTNWSQIGGEDLPVTIIAEPSGGGIRTLVEAQLLGGAPLAGDVRDLENASLVPSATSEVPGAFGISAESSAKDDGALILETDQPVSQPLYLVTKGSPSDAGLKVIEAARAFGS